MESVLETFLEFIEWPRVLEAIARRAESYPGHRHLKALRPVHALEDVSALQTLTSEALSLLEGEPPSMSRLANLEDAFGEDELSISRLELFGVASTIELGRDARSAFARTPALLGLASLGDPEQEEGDLELAAAILQKIGPHGVIYDNASERLGKIRHALGAAYASLRDALQRVCYDPQVGPALLERSPTSLRGQPCLKVKATEARRVPGPIIQQLPGGGLLIEPDAAREHYNVIRHLQIDERAEEERIRVELSVQVAPRGPAIRALCAGLTRADAHLALARFAKEGEMARPELHVEDLAVDLRGLRHPLLVDEGSCVPIDLTLREERLVVISGPNGGGKTVAMKSVGLAATLAQVGAYVPASSARLPVFSGFLAVGEPQASLEEGVSTFQSHAQDLAAAIDASGAGSMALFDEVGIGTDPSEAVALAQAVLEYQLAEGGLTLTTTHLGPLKAFAERTERAANAAVGIDGEGRPTFELRLGEIGRSYALDVAQTQGLPASICERARRLHSGDS